MIRDAVKLAYLSLRHRKIRSWLTMVGIFIGIAAVVSLIGLGEGLRSAVMAQFNFLSTDVLTVQASGLNAGPPGEGVVHALKEEYLDEIEGISGVDLTIGRIIESAEMRFDGSSDFTFTGSMPEDSEKRKELQRIAQLEIAQGTMIRSKDQHRVVLGANYATSERFGTPIEPGDRVTIQDEDFEVSGILAKKGSFIVDNVILMNEDRMKELFTLNDTYDLILVKVTPGATMATVKDKVEDYLRDTRDADVGEEDFTVESPEQSLKNLDSTLFAIQLFVYIIASISIIIGGIGIANTMYTSVLERTKHIGVMKSLGARNSQIFLLFFIESGFLGSVGGFVGILFGSALAYGVTFLGQQALGTELLRVQISFGLILGSLAFSFLIGSFAGLLPAYQASQLKPVDALRYAG